ncbi:hypothetical protein C8R48DRAFT_778626 [Suillus tomentosus]|nr:hypothetical protein C8R48DRAFT_778626 [Suillus tomentosus]
MTHKDCCGPTYWDRWKLSYQDVEKEKVLSSGSRRSKRPEMGPAASMPAPAPCPELKFRTPLVQNCSLVSDYTLVPRTCINFEDISNTTTIPALTTVITKPEAALRRSSPDPTETGSGWRARVLQRVERVRAVGCGRGARFERSKHSISIDPFRYLSTSTLLVFIGNEWPFAFFHFSRCKENKVPFRSYEHAILCLSPTKLLTGSASHNWRARAMSFILAEFCSEIPITHGKITVMRLMDVSSGARSTKDTTFRKRFSLPVGSEPSFADQYVTSAFRSTGNDDGLSETYSSIDMDSDALPNIKNQADSVNAVEDMRHVDADSFLNNALLSIPTAHLQRGQATEPSLYLKRFARKTPTLAYGWFEMTGLDQIDTPPSLSSFEDVQLGDLFLYRTDRGVLFWLRENSPDGGVWRAISPGDKGSLNEYFSCRILVLQSDGNPTWVLPKTVERYKRSIRTKVQDKGA